jgi:hypothetical protein
MKKHLVLFLLAAGASVAHAQPAPNPPPPPGQVEKLEASGSNHYTLAEYDAAITDFKEAYRLSQNPGFLYNIAQSYRMKKDCRESATFYKNYLRESTTQAGGKEPPNATKVRGFIKDMEECAKTQPLPPPPPTMTTTTTTTTQEPVDQPEPVAPAPNPRAWMKWAGIGGIAVGAIGVGLGLKFAVDGKGYNDDLQTKCATSCTSAEALAIQADGKAANRNAVIFSVAGGAVLAGGVALLVLSFTGNRAQPVAEEEEEPAASLQLTRGGVTASYAWRF